jgi:cytochrome P450
MSKQSVAHGPLTSPRTFADNPLNVIVGDVLEHRRLTRGRRLPPGPIGLGPTMRFVRDPLGFLLPAYERYGPVFSMRFLHMPAVWAMGPGAQHEVLVGKADKLHWREGMYRELIPLLGDGLISTDDEYHDRSRRLMLPVFHTERLAAATQTMGAEIDRALDALDPSAPLELYAWVREVGMRVAMRALFGINPEGDDAARTAREFERGLSYYAVAFPFWLLHAPCTPHARRASARRRLAELVIAEIARRRRAGAVDGEDILSLLMAAEDDDGWRFSDTQLLDHSLTLLFAGHDTTTTTVALALYELARHPQWRARVHDELDAELKGERATEEQLFSGLPVLEQVLDETLRLYPPVPAGLRRATEDVEIGGHLIPAGTSVNYCSWAGHRLADVFPDPHAFRPERMTREEKAKLPKGAYIPFGGGKRICIGKRFGYLEAKVLTSRILQRYEPELDPGFRLQVKWAATLIPDGGIPMRMAHR